jgi:hypothetical protein
VHPKLRQAALHVSISAATGEKLTDDQWRELAKRFMDGMGLDNNQYFITRHTNTEHEHIHILVNRIQFDGRVTDASWDYLRCQKIMRELERDFGLQAVPSSRDVGRKELTWREVEFCLRTGIPSQRMQLQELCDAAAMDCKSFSQYQARLEAMGVELVPFIQNEGATLRGICYRLDEVIFKGRDLGRSYSPAGLTKRGVTYEQERDFAEVLHCLEREEGRRFDREDRGLEAVQRAERAGVDLDVGTPCPEICLSIGANAPDFDRDPGRSPATGRRAQPPDQRLGPELEGSDSGYRDGSREHLSARGAVEMASVRFEPGDGIARGSAGEHVMAVAGAAGNPEQFPGYESDRPSAKASDNRDLEIFQRLLAEPACRQGQLLATVPNLTLEQQEKALEKLQAEKHLELSKLKEQLITDPQRRLKVIQDLCPRYEANLLAKQKVEERLLTWEKAVKAWQQEGVEHGWRLDSKMADFFKSQKHKEWEL